MVNHSAIYTLQTIKGSFCSFNSIFCFVFWEKRFHIFLDSIFAKFLEVLMEIFEVSMFGTLPYPYNNR
jgi:hypothetical protein